jgi:DNA repair photolyase
LIAEKIVDFEKKSWAIKPYAAFRWGQDMPCPIRLVVNPYKGCSYKHKYCYAWYKCQQPSIKEGFRKSLLKDIKKAKAMGLDEFLVMVSSSTDPFQPIEKGFKETLFTLTELLNNGFKVLIMTRNPAILLEKDYLSLAKNPNLFIDVSLPSLQENNPNSFFYGCTPKIELTLEAIKKLSELGKEVRIKIEPIVPTVGSIKGQTKEELDELVRLLKQSGVKLVIAKTMRLNADVPPEVYNELIAYYKKNGVKQGINLVLSKEVRKKLLAPLLDSCKKYCLPFCSCVETEIFSEELTVKCLCSGESALPIMSVVKDLPKEWKTEEAPEDLINGCEIV